MIFHNILIEWYLKKNRILPWRETKQPYPIWLSEVILQQTQVSQGLPYFERFLARFPTVFDLAEADEQEVLKLWQGLGYYSRARNLHQTAKHVANELKGRFPSNYKGLLGLKGVGDYTASAIASICFNEPAAVVDGNVYRVLARYFGIKTPINSSKGIKEFKALAEELMDRDRPGTYNQAIMDFGALQCKPKTPRCESCPLSSSCTALALDSIATLPVKQKKIKIKKRYLNYFFVKTSTHETIIQERTGKGIWQGLYEFPVIEMDKEANVEELQREDKFRQLFPQATTPFLFNEKMIVHKLSHQHLYTKFWIVEDLALMGTRIPIAALNKYPVPVLIDNFLKAFLNNTN